MEEHPSAVGTVWVAEDGRGLRIYTNRQDAEEEMFNTCVDAIHDASSVEIREKEDSTVIRAPDIATIYIDEIEVYGNPNAATFLPIAPDPVEYSILEEEFEDTN